MTIAPDAVHTPEVTLESAVAGIAAAAGARDRVSEPGFPDDAFDALRAAGVLGWNALAGADRPPAADELALVRRVAAADGSVGRIYDGHLNGIERLAVQGPDALVQSELPAAARGDLRVGVWGANPGPGEGTPAAVGDRPGGRVLDGVKTFCSGAGGLDRALVLASGEPGAPPLAVWIDVSDTDRVEVDRGWYRSAGLRASESHRVVFHDAPVLAQFGPPGGLSVQPWFARDAMRTCASWAGMADTAFNSAMHEIAARSAPGDLDGLAAGRMLTAHRTIDVWLDRAAEAMDDGEELVEVALCARVAVSDAIRTILSEAERACGSRPFARGSALDRARRDLEVFLLQHRLDPMLARHGRQALETWR